MTNLFDNKHFVPLVGTINPLQSVESGLDLLSNFFNGFQKPLFGETTSMPPPVAALSTVAVPQVERADLVAVRDERRRKTAASDDEDEDYVQENKKSRKADTKKSSDDDDNDDGEETSRVTKVVKKTKTTKSKTVVTTTTTGDDDEDKPRRAYGVKYRLLNSADHASVMPAPAPMPVPKAMEKLCPLRNVDLNDRVRLPMAMRIEVLVTCNDKHVCISGFYDINTAKVFVRPPTTPEEALWPTNTAFDQSVARIGHQSVRIAHVKTFGDTLVPHIFTSPTAFINQCLWHGRMFNFASVNDVTLEQMRAAWPPSDEKPTETAYGVVLSAAGFKTTSTYAIKGVSISCGRKSGHDANVRIYAVTDKPSGDAPADGKYYTFKQFNELLITTARDHGVALFKNKNIPGATLRLTPPEGGKNRGSAMAVKNEEGDNESDDGDEIDEPKPKRTHVGWKKSNKNKTEELPSISDSEGEIVIATSAQPTMITVTPVAPTPTSVGRSRKRKAAPTSATASSAPPTAAPKRVRKPVVPKSAPAKIDVASIELINTCEPLDNGDFDTSPKEESLFTPSTPVFSATKSSSSVSEPTDKGSCSGRTGAPGSLIGSLLDKLRPQVTLAVSPPRSPSRQSSATRALVPLKRRPTAEPHQIVVPLEPLTGSQKTMLRQGVCEGKWASEALRALVSRQPHLVDEARRNFKCSEPSLVIGLVVTATEWATVQRAIRDADGECGARAVVAGVQRGWEQICQHGALPAKLPYSAYAYAGDDERRYDANAAKVRRVGQRIELPGGRDNDIEPLRQWGVQVCAPIAAGETVGTYEGRVLFGGMPELLGEEMVYRMAGFDAAEAEDDYAISGVRLADGREVVMSARGPDYFNCSLMAFINCRGARDYDAVNCAFHENSNAVFATRDLAAGEMLCIDYGDEYYIKMAARGIIIGQPGECDEPDLPMRATSSTPSSPTRNVARDLFTELTAVSRQLHVDQVLNEYFGIDCIGGADAMSHDDNNNSGDTDCAPVPLVKVPTQPPKWTADQRDTAVELALADANSDSCSSDYDALRTSLQFGSDADDYGRSTSSKACTNLRHSPAESSIDDVAAMFAPVKPAPVSRFYTGFTTVNEDELMV